MTADLRRWLSELSRATSRHRAVLAAGLAAAAVATALPTFAPTPVPGRLVLTAARDLAAGTALTPADLAPVTLPRALVPTGALATDGAALGRLLAGPVRRGDASFTLPISTKIRCSTSVRPTSLAISWLFYRILGREHSFRQRR